MCERWERAVGKMGDKRWARWVTSGGQERWARVDKISEQDVDWMGFLIEQVGEGGQEKHDHRS